MKKYKVNIVIGLLSVLILSFVLFIVYFDRSSIITVSWINYIPISNAFFNFLTSVFLIAAYISIKRKNIEQHKKFIFMAVSASLLFLVGYSAYHIMHGETKFLGVGVIRYSYFFLLISHIILSFFQVPLILATLYHGINENFAVHRKLAKWTFPIWLYVSVTGVLVFFYLYYLQPS